MKAFDLKTMPIDDLRQLYEELVRTLAEQLTSEKHKLERRASSEVMRRIPHRERQRRAYPKVYPKYQNPDDPSQTWTGRGRTPQWFSEMLTAGRSIDDLRIGASDVPFAK